MSEFYFPMDIHFTVRIKIDEDLLKIDDEILQKLEKYIDSEINKALVKPSSGISDKLFHENLHGEVSDKKLGSILGISEHIS